MLPNRKRNRVSEKVFEARILAPPASTFLAKSTSDFLQSSSHREPLPPSLIDSPPVQAVGKPQLSA